MATGVYFFDRIRAHWAAPLTRRIDWYGIFDSNAFRNSTSGYAQAFQLALATAKGSWAGAVTQGIVGGAWGAQRNNWDSIGQNIVNNSTGQPPVQFGRFQIPTSVGNGYADSVTMYIESGVQASYATSTNSTCILGRISGTTAVHSPSDAFLVRIEYGLFSSGSASQAFRLTARFGGSIVADYGSNISTIDATNAWTLATATLAVPAGSRTEIAFEARNFYSSEFVGPFYSPHFRAERSAVSAGTAYSPLLYQGGQCAWNAAGTLVAAGVTPLARKFRFACQGHVGAPMLVVQICHGGNDPNYGAYPSYDPDTFLPDGAASNTGTGFQRNIATIIAMCDKAWASNGSAYLPQNIAYVIGPYHPKYTGGTATTFNAWLDTSYNAVIAWLAANPTINACVIKGNELVTGAVMEAGGEYNGTGGFDEAHLSNTGNTNHATRGVTALDSASTETVTLTSPTAGPYARGATITLSGTAANVSSVRIDISTDGGSTWSTNVANATVTSGNWSTTYAIPAGANASSVHIRAYDASRTDASGASVTATGYSFVAGIDTAAADINNTRTILGITGTQSVAAIQSAAAAAQLVTDTAAVNAKSAYIREGQAILGVSGRDELPPEAAVSAGVGYGTDGEEFEGVGMVTADDVLAAVAGTGTGARTVTITVNDGDDAINSALVRLTSGVDTYTGSTNGAGVVTFNVDDATYTVSITRGGYTFAGASLVVNGDETQTYSMAAQAAGNGVAVPGLAN